jgi:hypothetical protein
MYDTPRPPPDNTHYFPLKALRELLNPSSPVDDKSISQAPTFRFQTEVSGKKCIEGALLPRMKKFEPPCCVVCGTMGRSEIGWGGVGWREILMNRREDVR